VKEYNEVNKSEVLEIQYIYYIQNNKELKEQMKIYSKKNIMEQTKKKMLRKYLVNVVV
jgi:hypothetical protein